MSQPGAEPADTLALWVVYDHPRDFPERVVVRAQFPAADGSITVAPEAYLFPTLDAARAWLRARGLFCLARDPQDDPVIVETWL